MFIYTNTNNKPLKIHSLSSQVTRPRSISSDIPVSPAGIVVSTPWACNELHFTSKILITAGRITTSQHSPPDTNASPLGYHSVISFKVTLKININLSCISKLHFRYSKACTHRVHSHWWLAEVVGPSWLQSDSQTVATVKKQLFWISHSLLNF